MAFTPHAHCETPTGFNVTKGFEFCFKLGFYATAADFLNSSFFEFYVRQLNHADMQRYGHASARTQTLETVYAVMEWVFRGLFLLVTALQLLVRCSKTGRYCVHEEGSLKEEGVWLACLVFLQLFKVALMSVWHIVLNRKKKSFFSDQFDTTFFDQTTMMDDDPKSRRSYYSRRQQSLHNQSTRSHRRHKRERRYYDTPSYNASYDD